MPNGVDLSQYSDEELESIANQPDLSAYSNEELLKIVGEETKPTTGLLKAFGMGAGGAVTAGGAAFGIKKGYEALAPARTKMAGDLMNSIIKPRHKEYMFGKNPGKAMAQEGIWGTNIDSLGIKVGKRLTELSEYAKQLRSLSENTTKRVNLETILEPLTETLQDFNKAPLSNKGHINKINKIIQDIKGNIPEGANIKEVPLENAYGLKKVIENLQKWDVQSSADDKLNIALKKMYHNVDSSIDVVIPELKQVNSRIANLISAKNAIRNRAEILSRQDPTSLGNIVSLPIKGTVGSAAFKSGFAKILAEKFGIVGKVSKISKEIGKAGKKAIPILGISTSIFDALKYSKDPEGYMFQLETGQEMPPIGEEREEWRKEMLTT